PDVQFVSRCNRGGPAIRPCSWPVPSGSVPNSVGRPSTRSTTSSAPRGNGCETAAPRRLRKLVIPRSRTLTEPRERRRRPPRSALPAAVALLGVRIVGRFRQEPICHPCRAGGEARRDAGGRGRNSGGPGDDEFG